MFIVIEGIDGSGKTTQTDILIGRLHAAGIAFESISFPQYDKKSAGPVAEYLNGAYGTAEEVGPYRASLLFAVDRFDAKQSIIQWLKEDKVVIANRYVGSNLGHQGGNIADSLERARYFDWVLNLEYDILGIPKPDFNIIMDIPPKQAQLLIDKKQARAYLKSGTRDLLEADLAHLTRAAAIYKELALRMPNTHLIACMEDNSLLPPESIHQKIWHIIQPLITVS